VSFSGSSRSCTGFSRVLLGRDAEEIIVASTTAPVAFSILIPIKFSQKLFNRLISKRRFIVEQGFGTLKRRFCFGRASYISRLKVEAQLRLKAICFNLLKAVNLVSFA
jgi:hypothetical protein